MEIENMKTDRATLRELEREAVEAVFIKSRPPFAVHTPTPDPPTMTVIVGCGSVHVHV